MQHRRLGTSDLMVSPIAVGCWSFGGASNDYWGEQDQRDVDALVGEAMDIGANFFDTAYAYNDGRSEASLGKALAGNRGRAVICTKTPIQPSAEAFEAELARHLGLLGTDYVDVLMIHWPTRDRRLLEMNLLALRTAVEKGYARFAGVSNFSVGTMEIARELGVKIVANQFAYNLLSRAPERAIVPYCLEHSISINAYMSLMQGVLTGKYATISEVPERRRRTVQFDATHNRLVDTPHPVPPADRQVMDVVDALKRLAPEAGLTVSQLALAWCIHKPAVDSAIVGCRNSAQLSDNMRAAAKPLSGDLVAALDAASRPVLDIMGDTLDIFGRDRIW